MTTIYEGIPIRPFERKMIDGKRYYIIDENEMMMSVTSILSRLSAPGINAWRKRIGQEQADVICSSAAERGTIVHEMCEIYLKTRQQQQQSIEETNVNESSSECEETTTVKESSSNVNKLSHDDNILTMETFTRQFTNESYINICKDKQLFAYFTNSFLPMLHQISDVEYQEVQLYSRTYKYAGTVDCIGKFNNIPSIIDFKTSSKPKLKKYIISYFLQTAAYSIAYRELTGINIEQLVILIGVRNDSCEQQQPCSYQIFLENINNICPTTNKSWSDTFLDLIK